jgi:hypothetical protein
MVRSLAPLLVTTVGACLPPEVGEASRLCAFLSTQSLGPTAVAAARKQRFFIEFRINLYPLNIAVAPKETELLLLLEPSLVLSSVPRLVLSSVPRLVLSSVPSLVPSLDLPVSVDARAVSVASQLSTADM